MKKILLVNTGYKTGGIKKSLDNLISYLSENNQVDIQFLSQPDPAAVAELQRKCRILNPLFLLDACITPGNEIKKRQFAICRFGIKAFLRLLRIALGSEKLIQLLIRLSPDREGYDIAIAFSHDSFLNNGFSGGCNYFVLNRVKAKKKYAWIHGEPKTIGLNEERAVRTYTGFTEVVNVSEACNSVFQELTDGRINSIVINNLFDTQDILEKAKEPIDLKKRNDFCLVTVARVEPVKRLDRVIEASRMLLNDGYDFQWLIVGGGSKLEELKRQAASYGLQDRIIFVGQQRNPYKYMSKADLFVLTSDSEAFSSVMNEALICGIPVLTTDFPTAKEIVIPEENGFIVEKNPEAIYRQIAYCIKHREEIEEMKRSIKELNWGEKMNQDSKAKLQRLLE